MRIWAFGGLAVVAASLGLSADQLTPLRREVRVRHAVVAAGRSFSADAGAAMLVSGGNAIDAGVATIFAAAVVEISHFGLGGESPIIIYSARDREVVVINGQGPAPRAATPATFAQRGSIPPNGPLAATVPAVVDAAAIALTRYGTKSLSEVLAPAITLADGFELYEFLRRYLESEKRHAETFLWTMRTYYPEGRIPPTGSIFRQPNLARTLRALAAAEQAALAGGAAREQGIAAGRDAFYKGDIAKRIVAANREAGGLFSEEDLANYQGRVEKPFSIKYRGHDIYKPGPWNQGPVLLQALQILEEFDLRAMGAGSADARHAIVEAIKLAFADRDRYYGDPDFVRVPMQGLLSDAYAAERRRAIDMKQASAELRPGDPWRFDPAGSPSTGPAGAATSPTNRVRAGAGEAIAKRSESGDTTAIEIVDAQGNLFSSTPSSGWLLGGAFVAGDTGVPLGNRLQVFRLDPKSPNVLVGGKRPRTTLTPTVVLKDGKPFLAIGTPGGDNQDQQILQVLLNVIDFGFDIQAAIEAPRVNSLHPESSFDRHESFPNVLEAEASASQAIIEDLRRRGHIIRTRPAYGVSTGVVAAGIDSATGLLRGGADPRRERYIVAW
jgi:gamma-glutamyltranspeptidase/glutathione hydrolase